MAETTTPEGEPVGVMKNTFWLDGYEGKCNSGFYIRNNLFEKIADFEKMGYKVVGIKVEPGSWNLEFICKKPEKKDEKKN